MGKPSSSKITSRVKGVPKISHIEEEKFMGIMRQIGENSLNNLSPENITEVIKQRGKIAEYIHEESMQEHERFKIAQKNSLIQLGILLLFAISVLGLVAYVDKTHIPQAISLIIGFVGGYGARGLFKESQVKKE